MPTPHPISLAVCGRYQSSWLTNLPSRARVFLTVCITGAHRSLDHGALNSANAPVIWNSSFPMGVVGSMFQVEVDAGRLEALDRAKEVIFPSSSRFPPVSAECGDEVSPPH